MCFSGGSTYHLNLIVVQSQSLKVSHTLIHMHILTRTHLYHGHHYYHHLYTSTPLPAYSWHTQLTPDACQDYQKAKTIHIRGLDRNSSH